MKNFIYTLLLVTFLFSCAEENTLDNINLQDYFWNLDDYSVEKVLVYDIAVGYENIQGYYKLSKIANNKLKITSYDQDFDFRHETINLYNDNGVMLERMSIYPTGDSVNKVNCNIIDGNVFPFSNDNKSSINHFTYSTETYPDARETTISDFKELKTLACGDTVRNTIVSNGKLTRFFNELNEFEYPIEYWYSEGFGLSKLKIAYADFDYIETYKETISMEEFNNLKRDPI